MSATQDQIEYWLARAAADEVELEEALGDLDDYRAEVLRQAADLLTARGYAIPADLILQMAKKETR